MRTPNIVDLPQHDETMAAVEGLRRALPALVQVAPTIAKIRRAHYDALVAEGLRPNEALVLCQNTEL